MQLGSAGFNQTSSSTKRAGLAVILIIGAVLMIGIFSLVKSFEGTTTVNNIEVGDCLKDFFPSDDNGESEIFFVKTIDCEKPHAMEVYGASESTYFGLTEFPGQNEAFDIGQLYCLEQYELFTGVPAIESPYEMWTLVPVRGSWAQGDRTVQCLIGSFDEVTLVEGTLRGSGTGF